MPYQPHKHVFDPNHPFGGGGASQYDYYVDSVNGNDANDGRAPSRALKTLRALPVITAGMRIGLACGSHWREQLTIVANNVTVGAYGGGGKPVLDCSDLIADGDWSKTGGLTNVYQCDKSPALDVAETYNGVFEDGVPLTWVASTALCDATAGSFYPSSNTVAPCTLYIHATDSGDPSSNGKTYTFASRLNAINSYGYTGVSIAGVSGQYCLNGSGNFRIGNNSTLTNCLSTWGVKHNYYIGEGCVLTDCVATDIRQYTTGGSTGTLYVFNSNNPAGGGCQFIRCVAQSTAQNTTGSGFYGHRSGVGNFGTVTFDSCTVSKMGIGIYGLDAALRIINPTITSCQYGVSVDAGCDGVDIDGGTFSTGIAAARSIGIGASVPVTIDDFTITHTAAVSGASIYMAAGVAPDLTIDNLAITVISGSLFTRAYGSTGGTIDVTNTRYLGGSTDSAVYYTIAGGPTITSDYNNFALATYDFTIGGTGYANVAAYKAATGQDANSTIG